MPDESIENALPEFGRFLRAHWLKLLAISAVMLIPCFWHREIVSSDLGSHVYNAWLVQLIQRGQAPGLWIAPQHTNILFDVWLSTLGPRLGWNAAGKISVSLAVLIFFWGAFAFVGAISRRAPWFLTPCIALVAYGWTFHLGLFNYYISLGLSFFALALLWVGKRWERLIALAIAPFVVIAHPLGLIWLGAAAAYLICFRVAPAPYRWLVFLAAAAVLWAIHYELGHFFSIEAPPKPFYSFNGADQLVLFGERYRVIARLVLGFALLALALDFIQRRRQALRNYALPLQLYLLLGLSAALLPQAVDMPDPMATLALLTERLTCVSAVVGCCLLGAMSPRKWHLAALAAIAAVFFVFLYQDTARVNRMQAAVDRLVDTLPPNQRVMATILPPSGSRILVQHLIDRACIEHCFSYGNYEPGSADFRVRAEPGNPYVLSDYDQAVDMENGGYVIQPGDLPVYQVYQCNAAGDKFCICSLKAGEMNDSLGVHPDD